jgi:hypothetical protein
MAMLLRRFLGVLGGLALLIGLIWIGQGSGLLHYPASSFMIGQPEWAYYGAGLAIIGGVLIGVSRLR